MNVGWMIFDSAFEWIGAHLPIGSTILGLGSCRIASEGDTGSMIKVYFESVINIGE